MSALAPYVQDLRKFTETCRDCGEYGTIIEDPKQGDLICKKCGLVAEQRMIDDSSECRTFQNDDKQGASGPERTTKGESTVVAGHQRMQNLNERNGEQRGAEKRHEMIINGIIDKMGLADGHVARALAKEYCEAARKGNFNVNFAAVCVFLACRVSGVIKSMAEIEAATEGASMILMSKIYTKLHKERHFSEIIADVNIRTPKVMQFVFVYFMKFFGKKRIYFQKYERNAFALFQKYDDSNSNRKPQTAAAAIVLKTMDLVGDFEDEDKADVLKKLSELSGVSMPTITLCMNNDLQK